jgi:hypothetical protein
MWTRFPFHAVIERATSKERYGGKGEDASGDATAKFTGDSYQDQPSHQRDWGHDEVNYPSKTGFSRDFGHFGKHKGLAQESPSACREGKNGLFLGEQE